MKRKLQLFAGEKWSTEQKMTKQVVVSFLAISDIYHLYYAPCICQKTLFPIHRAVIHRKALVCASCLAELGISEEHQLLCLVVPWAIQQLLLFFCYLILKDNVKVADWPHQLKSCPLWLWYRYGIGPGHSWHPWIYHLMLLGPSGRTDLNV